MYSGRDAEAPLGVRDLLVRNPNRIQIAERRPDLEQRLMTLVRKHAKAIPGGVFAYFGSCRPFTRVHSCASIEVCDWRSGF